MTTDESPAPDDATSDAQPGEIEADFETPIEHIFRWDLDKTYLRTDFDTIRDLIKTAMQTAEDKINVPGAVELLRELDQGHEHSLLTFVSGSPTQMRDTLERKFKLDGIQPDIFILKPTLSYILTGKFGAIRGQVGYKLDTLLEVRSRTPLAPETMFGDDAEQDAFIYSLYADIAAGRVSLEHLAEILLEAEVHEDMCHSVLRRAQLIDERDTVRRIFIHLEARTPPGRFWVFGPRVVPIVNYFQSAAVLYADGTLEADSVLRVAAAMLHAHGYGVPELANSFEDLMRRRHLDAEVVDRLAEEVDTLEDLPAELPPGFVEQLLSRARSLAPRASLGTRDWQGPPDYLDILRSDRALSEAVKDDGK